MRTALAIVLLLLLAGLVQHSQTTELADEVTVFATDEYAPYANITMGANQDIAANIVLTGTKSVAGQDWDVYRLTLDETGQLNVEFEGSNSNDPDATTGNGIQTYEWKIYFDTPFGGDFVLEPHTFSEPASSNGLFTYSFQNVTVSEDGTQESQIRMELRVYDSVGKVSEKFRMYFVVGDEGSVDQEPVFQFDASYNMTSTDSDVFYINGSLVSGSEMGEVYVEAAFSMDDFNASAIGKYSLSLEGLWVKTTALSDGDAFSLMLSIDGFYTNLSETMHIYFKTYEGDNERWTTYHWFEITLMACQGLIAPEDAIKAGGEFILDEDGECQWDGEWTYDSSTNQWAVASPSTSVEFTGSSQVSRSSENSYSTSPSGAFDGSDSTSAFFVIRSCAGEDCSQMSFLDMDYSLMPTTAANQIEFEWNIQPYDSFTPTNSQTNFSMFNHTSMNWDLKQAVSGSTSDWELVTVNFSNAYLGSSGQIDLQISGFHDDTGDFSDELGIWIREFHLSSNGDVVNDFDFDGIIDSSDDCPYGDMGWTSNPSTDGDGDGCQDITEDGDDDNDGVDDSNDSFPFNALEWLDTDADGVGDNSDYAPYDPSVWEYDNDNDTSTYCEEWEYWNPDQIDTSLPGNGCPHYEATNSDDGDGDGDGTSTGDGTDGEDDESVPGFELWLVILALLFAVSFRRKLNV
jgi:hypothetical protein